jgi:large subunit ribosomal protein L23
MENKKNNKIFQKSITLIKNPIITEKSIYLLKKQYYTFLVDRFLTKPEIKVIFENFFDTKIFKINTCILPLKQKRVGKYIGRCSKYKKIFIKFEKDDFMNNLYKF